MRQELFGISEKSYAKLMEIFAHHSNIEQVVIYGSRAMGTQRTGSDIDLTLFGKDLNLNLVLKIQNEIDDSMIPYLVDLSIYSELDSQNLVDHIHRVGKVFYKAK